MKLRGIIVINYEELAKILGLEDGQEIMQVISDGKDSEIDAIRIKFKGLGGYQHITGCQIPHIGFEHLAERIKEGKK